MPLNQETHMFRTLLCYMCQHRPRDQVCETIQRQYCPQPFRATLPEMTQRILYTSPTKVTY